MSTIPPGSPNASPLEKLQKLFEQYLVTKAPYTLSPKIKEFIVKFTPWATIVVFVLALPLVIGVLGLGALFAPLGMMGGYGYGYGYGTGMLSLLLVAVTMVLEIVAVPGLFKRSLKSWSIMYYVVLIRAVADLIGFDLFSFVLSIIPLYFLFQVKALYRKDV